MSNILRISDAATLGLHAMAVLAAKKDKELITNKEIAEIIHVSEAHLSKVMQRLSKNGLIESTRGPKGGLAVSGDPQKIDLLTIYEAIEGPLTFSNCLLKQENCNRSTCILSGLIHKINDEVKSYLSETTIDMLIEDENNGTSSR